jgi:Protein of unknown function (DUF1674)
MVENNFCFIAGRNILARPVSAYEYPPMKKDNAPTVSDQRGSPPGSPPGSLVKAPAGSVKPAPGTQAVPESGGRGGPDPTRYGDWEKNGRCVDF